MRRKVLLAKEKWVQVGHEARVICDICAIWLGYSSDDVRTSQPHTLLIGWEQNLILKLHVSLWRRVLVTSNGQTG